MELEFISEPANCKECSESCVLKRQGCPFDIGQSLAEMKASLAAMGLPSVDDSQTMAALKEQAKECRREIIIEAKAENQLTKISERVIQRIGAVARPSVPAPMPVTPRPIVEAPSKEPKPEEPTGEDLAGLQPTWQDEGYLSEEDQIMEGQVRDLDGVYGVCTAPKLNKDNLDKHIQEIASPVFAEEPFDGLVAAIPKRVGASGHLVRVTAYYKGPSPNEPETRALIKQRKAGLKQATA